MKVAIIGGGCGSISAAFELSRPEHQGKYEVTVYQLGWRLGGKGASGRGPADRIEEHGLHLWMGFYENAFRLMRECYAELGRDPSRCRIADWRDAFAPANFNAVADFSPSLGWTPWTVLFPPAPGLPGDPATDQQPWTIDRYLLRCASLLRTLLESVAQRTPDRAPAQAATGHEGAAGVAQATTVRSISRYGGLAALAAAREALLIFESTFRSTELLPEATLNAFHERVVEAVHARLDGLTSADDELRRVWEIIDLVLAVIRGSIRFRLLANERGFDAIDDYDCREWLRLNGASARSIDSAFVRALYDLAFAYEDGDLDRPRIAAGQALRGVLRAFFTYRGAFFWRMRAGMGDVVFAPFYEVLLRRGVRFEFFHRLKNIELGEAGEGQRPFVAGLEFEVQAEVLGGRAYQPLVDVRGLPCWPAAPDFSQLVEGERLAREGVCFESHFETRFARKKRLRVGADFDAVVLGVGLGALPHVAEQLIERDPRFRAMVRNCKSVPTQAFQIWLDADMHELGWQHEPGALSGYVEPFDTWADMTHLIEEESWPEPPPRAIAYFCSALRDSPLDRSPAPADRQRRRDEVRRNAVQFLNRDVAALWPEACGEPGNFRWELLRAPTGSPAAEGEQRFDAQYWTANVNPSDRYALSLPGTLRHRVSPLDVLFDNLTVAGDWTDCGFNEGCVEAAVMSGRLAAHALSGRPALTEIPGYDHP